MRRFWIAVGILILLAGLIIGVVGNVQLNSTSLTTDHRAASYTSSDLLIDGGSVSVSWSNAPANATFAFYQCANSGCTTETTVAVGGGASGQFSSTTSSAQTFQIRLVGPNSTLPDLNVTIAWETSGFTYVALAGAGLSVGGVGVILAALRRS